MTRFFIRLREEIKVKQLHLPINLQPLRLQRFHLFLDLLHIALLDLLEVKLKDINLQLKAFLVDIMMALVVLVVAVCAEIFLLVDPTLEFG